MAVDKLLDPQHDVYGDGARFGVGEVHVVFHDGAVDRRELRNLLFFGRVDDDPVHRIGILRHVLGRRDFGLHRARQRSDCVRRADAHGTRQHRDANRTGGVVLNVVDAAKILIRANPRAMSGTRVNAFSASERGLSKRRARTKSAVAA